MSTILHWKAILYQVKELSPPIHLSLCLPSFLRVRVGFSLLLSTLQNDVCFLHFHTSIHPHFLLSHTQYLFFISVFSPLRHPSLSPSPDSLLMLSLSLFLVLLLLSFSFSPLCLHWSPSFPHAGWLFHLVAFVLFCFPAKFAPRSALYDNVIQQFSCYFTSFAHTRLTLSV